MDVTVQWDETEGPAGSSFARVSSVASPDTLESPSRDVVTLYGVPTPESLALALAAAVEARRGSESTALPQLDVSEAHGAVGDSAYRDTRTGEVIRREMAIPLTVLKETAADLLKEGGQAIRRVLAGLLMPDWPEGTRRSLTVQLAVAGAARNSDMLAAMREADADNFREEE